MVPDVLRWRGGIVGAGIQWRLTGEVGLMRRRAWTWTEYTGARCPERHMPRLDHAGPGVYAWCPSRRTTGSGGVATLVLLVVATVTTAASPAPTAALGVVARGRSAGDWRWRPSTAGSTVGRSRWPGAADGEQGVLGRGLGMLLVVLFLQEKVGSRRKEGVRWLARGDRWDRVAVLGTEPAQHVEDLARLAHRLASKKQRHSS